MDPKDAQKRARAGLRRLGVPLVLVAVLGAVAGCGSSDSGADAATPKAGDTLTIASPGAPPTLDPATGDNQYSDYFNLAYDPLIVQAPDGSFKPGLATKWSYGAQNKTFSMTLRPGVKFSDGTPLDGDAVKQWIEHALKVPGGRAGSYLGALAGVDVPSPEQVVLHFKAPTPQLELVFSQVLEMGLIGSPKALSGKTLTASTIGAGPYKLDPAGTVKGDHYAYVPNPNYYDKGNVHWKRVVIKVIANPSAALQALRANQVQVAVGQPVSTLDAARRAGLQTVSPLTLLLGLGLNDREGKLAEPLGDVRVRQALNYAVDRKAVAQVVGAGHGQPISQMAVPGDDSYDESLADAYPYDPAKARSLLADAGYPKGFELKTLASNIVGQDTLAQAVAGQLEKVGVKLKPLDVKGQISDYFTNLANGSYPAATIAFGRLPAAFDYGALYGPNAGPFNPFKSKSARLDKLFAQLSAADGDSAEPIAREMQSLITKQAWFLPVVATPLVVLHSASVTGVDATPQRDVIYTTEIRPK